MSRRTLLIAALIGGCSIQVTAQEFLPNDEAGDKEYKKVVREYEIKSDNSIELLYDYLDNHPDSRFKNRVEALIGSAYFDKGEYKEAIALLNSCNFDRLSKRECELFTYKLAVSYLKQGNLKDAYTRFSILKEISENFKEDAVFNMAYIDYSNQKYDNALSGFKSVQHEEKFKNKATYFIGEIYLLKKDYQKALDISKDYLSKYQDCKESIELLRIAGEASYYLEDYTSAVKYLDLYVSNSNCANRNTLYMLGMSYYNIGVYSKAVEQLSKTTTHSDELSQSAYYNMGLANLNMKAREMARMSFEQASNYSFNKKIKEKAMYNYALLIHETSYSPFAESVTVFEKFLNDFPSSVYTEKVNNYLVDVYFNTKSYDAALASIQKIKKPGTTILEAKQKILFQLGTQAFVNSDYDASLSLFEQSLSLGQYNKDVKAKTYYWLAETKYRKGEYRSAINNYKNYLSTTNYKNSEEYLLALYNIGYSYFKQSNYNEALPWFAKVIKSNLTKSSIVLADSYNRLGDCNYYSRRFDIAERNYSNATRIDNSMADYSLYQQAFIKGLKKDYNGKISTLNKVISEYPSSQYVDDAIYEQGRAFVQMEDNTNAIKRFDLLVDKFPNSNYAKKAVSEKALLYYQDNNYSQAIETYKYVIANYPESEESRMAKRDLKSIYIDLNRVDEYASFVKTVPGMSSLENNEIDSLTFIAAEKVYMRGNTIEARNSFNSYLSSFPNGSYSIDANFNVGLIDFNNKSYQDAQAHLEKVLKYPSSKYYEEALIMMSSMMYEKNDFTKSFELYSILINKASTNERKLSAEEGLLLSAYHLKKYNEVISSATNILKNSKLSPELSNKAHFYRAKAYENKKEINKAKSDWKILSSDTRNVFGAEAKYRLAQIYYDQADLKNAENEILNYIDVSTPHAYWLARGFILLSDIYIKSNRNMEAKQYLLSLKQNYHSKDDIAEMIESRLRKL